MMVFQTYTLTVVVILVATETQNRIKQQIFLLSWIRPILAHKQPYIDYTGCPLSSPPTTNRNFSTQNF